MLGPPVVNTKFVKKILKERRINYKDDSEKENWSPSLYKISTPEKVKKTGYIRGHYLTTLLE